MALINISFDTVSKAMTATVDGAALSNVVGCNIYQSWDDAEAYRCEVVQMAKNKADDTVTMTRVCASEDGTMASASAPVKSKLEREIDSFFGRA